ncbi:hypothetical protein F0310_02030 [Borrelia sp. A-FGy1]|uniref:hypothetical protein n=1 Tax=Borrelia sp. A-FGy1 TaxID=2608247 RepID=UPI0015F7661E|nr:hypothetical protein [Borrelia sp. A-FGy1]QMU99197.1 hypothetical protein F0310_02030 [Borrelia sp. A-FGy1]
MPKMKIILDKEQVIDFFYNNIYSVTKLEIQISFKPRYAIQIVNKTIYSEYKIGI